MRPLLANPYNKGDTLFRLLVTIRLTTRSLKNRLTNRFKVPAGLINAKALANTDPTACYKAITPAHTIHHPKQPHLPAGVNSVKDSHTAPYLPEQFILEIENGRVFGEGFVITKDNKLITETSPDFHRKPDFHWLLSAGKLPKPVFIDKTVAVIASPGSGNYFHWTIDAVPRFSILRERMFDIDLFYILGNTNFQKEWLNWLGIPKEMIFVAGQQTHIWARKIILPSFAGSSGLPSKDAIDFIRGHMPPSVKISDRKLFISRAGASRRKILREHRLYPVLQGAGFEIIFPGKMTVQEQMHTFSGATHIIAPHGAELTNLVYSRPGTKVLEIFSPYYKNFCYANLATILSLDYRFILGNGQQSKMHKQIDYHHLWRNINISPTCIQKALSDLTQ